MSIELRPHDERSECVGKIMCIDGIQPVVVQKLQKRVQHLQLPTLYLCEHFPVKDLVLRNLHVQTKPVVL